MMTTLENEFIKVQSKAEGAELTSLVLKKDQTEYLWQADPKVWARHAPVLFPIVGKLHDNKYAIGEREYQLPQHGFARDRVFELLESSASHVLYRLTDDEKSKQIYPYSFELAIEYRIRGTALEVRYKVTNLDKEEMYFSIGAHPGFNCPLLPHEKMEDYFLEFEKKETLKKMVLKDGLISHTESFLTHESIIPLSKELFKDDAIIVSSFASSSLALKCRSSNKSITVDFPGFPYLGIWSKPEGAPFVCIEPWFGVTDVKDDKREFDKKKGICPLSPLDTFECRYIITIQ
jgi:galactose mutarotase-like enzyme